MSIIVYLGSQPIMAKKLTGKVALVTGGSRGLGAAIASAEAGFVTGASLNIDGGFTA
ncbi:MAG: hypothetical protein RM338_19255 [Nostoc sp. DedQUE12a]|nr:hypothetical protein [Nostoc sp. DedQUE12a]